MKTTVILISEKDIDDLLLRISRLKLKKPVKVEFSYYHEKRDAWMNKRYWDWIQQIIDYFVLSTGEQKTKRQIDAWLLDMFAPMQVDEINGRVVSRVKSTSQMDSEEMATYLQKIDIYMGSVHDVILERKERDPQEWENMHAG